MIMRQQFQDPAVKAVFDAYSDGLRANLLRLRTLIFDTAAGLNSVGTVHECLKWGQPSYHPTRSRVGTTIRIDAVKGSDTAYALFVPCQTTLIDEFTELYPHKFHVEGKRAITFDHDRNPPIDAMRHCIGLALTYHARKRSNNPV